MKDVREILGQGTNIGRFIRFILVGGVNTVLGYLLFAALVLASVAPQPALAMSFSLSVLWNFWTHGKFVFGKQKYTRLPIYAACYIAIYIFNSAGLEMALRQGLAPLIAQAVIAPIAALLSYFLISRVLTGRFTAPD